MSIVYSETSKTVNIISSMNVKMLLHFKYIDNNPVSQL